MKVYYLEITPSDLEHLEDGRYVTNIIDFYSNDSYTNYSVVKSTYGFTPERTTWVGTQRAGSEELLSWEEIRDLDENFETDSGQVVDGRFIDTTGRIDIISFNVSSESSFVELTVHHSDSEDGDFFEEEWDYKGPVVTSHEVAIIDSGRYGRLVFDFGEESPSPMFLAYLRVEIDRPVMAPLYRSSRRLLDQFPEWMALADIPEEQDVAEMALPTSLGGSFLNAIAGEWLDDIRRQLSYHDFQRYISTVDMSQMAWAWKTSKLPRFITSIEGDGIELARTVDQAEFREAINDDACFIDVANDNLYTTKKYDQLIINEEEFNQEPHHMWNYLDEIGLFVDLPRINLESNEDYKLRILDVYKNRGGVGVEQLKLALRRELSLWKHFGVEIDSEFEGALPEILDIEDIERMNDPDDPARYFDPDGMPTVRFVELVERMSREYPTTWGRFSWGETIWDLAGKDYAGYSVIPYRYDAPQLDDRYAQSGVGDGDDMFVFRPDVVTGPREFEATLVARGKEKVWRTEYPAVNFNLRVRGVGTRDTYDHPEKVVAFTLEVTTNDSKTFVHQFLMSAKSDVDVQDFIDASPDQPRASDATLATYELFSEGENTSPDIKFRDTITNELYGEDGSIDIDDISQIRLIQGHLVAGTYQYVETQNHFETWFSSDPSSVLTFDSDPLVFSPTEVGSTIVMRSLHHASPVPVEWATEQHLFHIKVNGVAPFLERSDVTLDIPQEYIIWDPVVENRNIELQIQTTNVMREEDLNEYGASEYGGYTRNEKNEIVFIPASNIAIDGNSTWDEGAKLLSVNTESVDISVIEEEDLYPIVFPVWNIIHHSSDVVISGVVDENGPWRNGNPPSPGNTNFNLETIENLSRDNFGVPNSEDYMITWIGVEVDNSRVLTWLDNNTVKPAFETEALSYPETAIDEYYDEASDTFYYTPLTIRARVRPEPDPEWFPQIHSGYFYDRNQEYYFYANKQTEEVTTDEATLSGIARQGAPVIVTTNDEEPITLRQTAFTNITEDSVGLSLFNEQWVNGTGHAVLYLAYADIYDVTVEDADGNNIAASTSTDTNEIPTTVVTDFDEEYRVVYRVRNSYFVDYDYLVDGEQFTRIVFDSAPVDRYIVTYEGSSYDPATPVDLPLNPMYSMRTQGFIFISHNEYTLDSLRVRLSPANIISDGLDYMMISLDSMDEHGNPKPNQTFSVSTTFGSLDKTIVTTDHDGFAVIFLVSNDESEAITPTESGTITITGEIDAEVSFRVEQPNLIEPFLEATAKSEKIQADGFSQNLIYGRVIGADFQPINNVDVTWRKERSLYEVFTENEPADSGVVTTNQNGVFIVGPFSTQESEESGYWFMSLEAEIDGIPIGDVVFWYEYPVQILGVENVSGLPQLPVQMRTPVGTLPPYSLSVKYPTSYDELAPEPDEQDPDIQWLPPTWYAISAWDQYQMGIKSHKTHKLM